MKLKIVLQWFRLNLIFLVPFFLLMWMFIIFFPEVALRVFGQWAVLMQSVGAKNLRDFTSKSDIFTHILMMNSVTVILYFVIGIFLQSPLVMLFTGAFYASISFLAPYMIGRAFELNDWLLISVELFTLILSISLSSALAGDLFDVKPDARSLLHYWKYNWNKLFPKPVSNWKLVLRGWYGTALLVVSIIGALLLFVAWFESYGY